MALQRSRSASLASNGQPFVDPVVPDPLQETGEDRRSHKRSLSLGGRLKRALSSTSGKDDPVPHDPVPTEKSPKKSSKQKPGDVTTTVMRDIKKTQQTIIERIDDQQAQFATLQRQLTHIAKNMDLLYATSNVAGIESVDDKRHIIPRTKSRADGYQALEDEHAHAVKSSQCCTLI